jgi:hypothetical protein
LRFLVLKYIIWQPWSLAKGDLVERGREVEG